MHNVHRYRRIVMLLAVLALIVPTVLTVTVLPGGLMSVRAQEATLRLIPVTGSQLFGMALSADGKTAAVWENHVIRNSAPDLRYLPIRLFDVASGAEAGALVGASDYVSQAAFTPDGKWFVSMHINGWLYVWDVAARSLLTSYPFYAMGGARLRISADSRFAILLRGDLPMYFEQVDLASGATVARFGPTIPSFNAVREFAQVPERGEFMYIAFDVSPDGREVVFANANDKVMLLDTTTNVTRMLRPASERPMLLSIPEVRFWPDANTAAYLDIQGEQVVLVDTATGTARTTFRVAAQAVAFSPDGERVAFLNRAGEVLLGRVSAPEQVVKVAQVPEALTRPSRQSTIRFTPDGASLVIGGLVAMDEGNAIVVVDLLTAL